MSKIKKALVVGMSAASVVGGVTVAEFQEVQADSEVETSSTIKAETRTMSIIQERYVIDKPLAVSFCEAMGGKEVYELTNYKDRQYENPDRNNLQAIDEIVDSRVVGWEIFDDPNITDYSEHLYFNAIKQVNSDFEDDVLVTSKEELRGSVEIPGYIYNRTEETDGNVYHIYRPIVSIKLYEANDKNELSWIQGSNNKHLVVDKLNLIGTITGDYWGNLPETYEKNGKTYKLVTPFLEGEVAQIIHTIYREVVEPGTDSETTVDPTEPGTDGETTVDPTEPGTDGETTVDPTEPGTDGETEVVDPTEPGTDGETTVDPTEPGTDGETTVEPTEPGIEGETTVDPTEPGTDGETTVEPTEPGTDGETEVVDPTEPDTDGETTVDPTEPGTDGETTVDPTEPGTDGETEVVDPTEPGTDGETTVDPTEPGTDGETEVVDPTEPGTDGETTVESVKPVEPVNPIAPETGNETITSITAKPNSSANGGKLEVAKATLPQTGTTTSVITTLFASLFASLGITTLFKRKK